jgi:hypothetical protein
MSAIYQWFIRGSREMSIEAWAKKVTQAMHVLPGERPPFAAVLVDFIDEFDELQAKTKMSIPVFARALTRAGLTSASGGDCDPNVLRMQIKRARERRATIRPAEARQSAAGSAPVVKSVDLETIIPVHRLPQLPAANHRGEPHADLSVLKQLEQSKPIKVRRLDTNEG